MKDLMVAGMSRNTGGPMTNYDRIAIVTKKLSSSASGDELANAVVPLLVDVWLDDYARGNPGKNIVETTVDNFTYLFDIDRERLIAAWGTSRGKNTAPRPAARMAGHPLSGGPHYHRGHAIPHTLGGGTDINLVKQLGSVNTGKFRTLEIEAVKTPGAFYFTYWTYSSAQSQTPSGVEQGVLRAGADARISRHAN